MTRQKQRRKRRSLASLSAALEQASTSSAKARAHFELALFHDNNGREAQAIPHYRSALALGVEPAVEPEAFAWLASSLYKTGHAAEARRQALDALRLADDPSLSRFLVKRGYDGVCHHMSEKHLDRYVTEFEGRYSRRPVDTADQMSRMVKGADGKQPRYQDLVAA